MLKKVLALGIILCLVSLAYAQEEKITITTYYPSPYGSYRELRSQRMAIGDDYIQANQHCWPDDATCSPPDIDANADLVVQGNVGIGTAGPSKKFHVYEDISGYSEIIRIQNANASGQPYVVIGGPGVDHGINIGYKNSGNFGWISHTQLDPAGNGAGIIINSGGNVGIGTTNLNNGRFQVNGGNVYFSNTDAWGVSMIVRNDSGGNAWRWVTGGASGDGNVPPGGMAIHRDTAFSPLQIKNDGTVFMNVGNVAIGTPDPQGNRLRIVGGPTKTEGGLVIQVHDGTPAGVQEGQMWLDPNP